jgi:hypothetical protein
LMSAATQDSRPGSWQQTAVAFLSPPPLSGTLPSSTGVEGSEMKDRGRFEGGLDETEDAKRQCKNTLRVGTKTNFFDLKPTRHNDCIFRATTPQATKPRSDRISNDLTVKGELEDLKMLAGCLH